MSENATSRWQPIATADFGKLLLLFEPHAEGGFAFVGYSDEYGNWANNLDDKPQHPTHWMILDDLPIVAA